MHRDVYKRQASINANTLSAANPLNNAFCSFTVREMDVTDIGTDRNIPVFNLYSKNLLRESPQAVSYTHLDVYKRQLHD